MAKPLVALTTSDMMAYEIARTIRVLDEARRKDELQKLACIECGKIHEPGECMYEYDDPDDL